MGWVLGLGHWEGPCSMLSVLLASFIFIPPFFLFLFAMNADVMQ